MTSLLKSIDTKIILGLFFGFILIISSALLIMVRTAEKTRQEYRQTDLVSDTTPLTAVQRQVRKVMLERINADGEIEYIQILPSGQIIRYNKDMEIIEIGLLGYHVVKNLYDKINRNINLDEGDISFGGKGKYRLIIETNKGIVTIIIDNNNPNPGGGEFDDIIDDIEEIDDTTFNPTPTIQPSPTPVGFLPPSPTPTSTQQTLIPTATPSPIPGQPTPLPAYMLADPFTCDDYYTSGKPITISNILCGIEPSSD